MQNIADPTRPTPTYGSPKILNRLPSRTAQFVREHISSVHTLEVLLFLYQHRSRSFTCEDVLSHIRSSHAAAEACLSQLVHSSIVERTGAQPERFQFHPKQSSLAEAVDELAQHYAERSTTIIQLIYSRNG
jgi:hypothetical protein